MASNSAVMRLQIMTLDKDKDKDKIADLYSKLPETNTRGNA